MKLRPGHLVAVALTVALAASGSNAQVVFTDVSEQAGIGLTEWLTESVAWGDYDNDGDEDLYLTVDGPNHLFRNDGDGRFTNVTAEAGVATRGSALTPPSATSTTTATSISTLSTSNADSMCCTGTTDRSSPAGPSNSLTSPWPPARPSKGRAVA